jgi:uncharacterized protein YndB with AHSA1/START domain
MSSDHSFASPASRHELTLTRLMRAPRAAVWAAFAGQLDQFWCPRPWRAEVVAQELRPGGRFDTVMHGPDGERHAADGVFLEVIPAERVVFTDAFTSGWVPAGPFMVGVLAFADEDGGTRYTASVRHWRAEDADRHRAMGFADGWGKAAEQWEEVARRLAGLS